MSDSVVDLGRAETAAAPLPTLIGGAHIPVLARYGLAMAMVGLATVIAFAMKAQVVPASLTLVYVLPVVVAAVSFGWGPALASAVIGVLAFDFFFTFPFYSLRIDSPSDIWAAGLLLLVAALVSAVATEARRGALEARRYAVRAQALQALAHRVIEGQPIAEVAKGATAALTAVFDAPAMILVKAGDGFTPLAGVGRAQLAPRDEEAARGALETGIRARAGTYPYADADFDFWRINTPSGPPLVLGVKLGAESPAEPDPYAEIIGAYLAAALTGKSG
jgi:K+-sensing histidine kinase KdpD